MKNLKTIDSFLTEKKVVVKRKYTDKYPAKKSSTAARVRNAVLDAMSDGIITEEEMEKILSEIQAHHRWLKRNFKLFDISEDETGKKIYTLSKWGKRIKNRTRPINEALIIPHKEHGNKRVNIFVGRFQPFTLGHVKVFEKLHKENKLPVVVFTVRNKNTNKERVPFSEDIQQAMFAKMKQQYPFLESMQIVNTAAIDKLFASLRPAYEPVLWGFGTDRKKPYEYMINNKSYREDLNVLSEFSGHEIKRTDENISASKVRKALELDNENEFKKMTPKSIHSFYQALKNELEPIKENIKMKNLKSLNEFFNEYNMTKFTFDDAVNTVGELIRDEEKGIASVLKALGARNGRQISIMVDTTEPEGSDLYDAIKKMKTLPIKSNVYDKAYHGKYKGKNVVVFDGGEDLFAYVKESVELNEEYIEVMDPIRMANAMGEIQQIWDQWKNGPLTEPSDIKPAQRELKGWIDRWFKQNIK